MLKTFCFSHSQLFTNACITSSIILHFLYWCTVAIGLVLASTLFHHLRQRDHLPAESMHWNADEKYDCRNHFVPTIFTLQHYKNESWSTMSREKDKQKRALFKHHLYLSLCVNDGGLVQTLTCIFKKKKIGKWVHSFSSTAMFGLSWLGLAVLYWVVSSLFLNVFIDW